MAFYVVSYDLKEKTSHDYKNLWDALDGMDSVKTQKSVYYVSSTHTQSGLRDVIKQHMHNDDNLFVAEFTKRPNYANALAGTNAWLDRHFK